MTAAEPAKDRAWDVVDDVLAQYDQLIGDPAGRIVAALMADPDLLVDLAIEAGGLEQTDDYTPCCGDAEFGPYHADGCNRTTRPHWRRTTQENDRP